MFTLLLSTLLISSTPNWIEYQQTVQAPSTLEEEYELFDTFTELQTQKMRPFIEGIDRDADCLPYQNNQISLSNGQPLSASLIKVYDLSFIASQAPTSKSMPFFWQMVWEKEAEQIVMLCEPFELGKQVCHPYWPSFDNPYNFNGLQVSLLSNEFPLENLQVRKFLLTYEGEERIATHYWVHDWKDQNIISLESTKNVVDILIAKRKSNAPIIIHCHAGVGRTGTLITAYTIVKYGYQNLFDLVAQLRTQRPYMIGTYCQYEFCHKFNLQYGR